MFELNCLLRLRDQIVRSHRCVLRLPVEKLFRRLAGILDEPGGFGMGVLDDGGGFLLGGRELRLHFVRIFQAGGDLLLTLVQGGDHRLESEFPQHERDDREAEDLSQDERQADAEILRDLRNTARAFARGGVSGRGGSK